MDDPHPPHLRPSDPAARNEAVLRHMQMGLVVYWLREASDDRSLELEEANPAAASRLGLGPEDRGRPLVELFPGLKDPARLRTYADIARGAGPADLGEISYGDERRPRADYAVKAFPLPGRRVGILFEDITLQVTAREERRAFVAMVSHELRTPLTSIQGALSLLAGGRFGDPGAEGRELLAIAARNCDRLSRLINDLLHLEKVEAGRLDFSPAAVDARQILERVRSGLAAYATEAGVPVPLEAPESPVLLQADPDRLQQVLINLVSNAIKFSSPGSPVTLRLREAGAFLRFEVMDQGPGIPKAFQDRIFQKFTQSEAGAAKGGSGLGLSIAKALAERMGGSLGFESEEGRGTCFYATFPRWEEAGPGKEGPVLIVEDDPDVAHLLALVLEREGIRSEAVGTAEEARRLLEGPTRYRAMTLDLLLPEEDGLSLLRDVRARPDTRDLPVIVVSARAEEEQHSALEGQALGVLDWLDKPVDLERLRQVLRRALGTREGPPRRVLHVEDDPDVRAVVASLLQDLARVHQAGDLGSARAWLRQETPEVVLLDLLLPDGNGLDLLPDLAGPGKAPPPVVIFSSREPPQEMLGQVAASLVKSRHTHEELREVILKLLS